MSGDGEARVQVLAQRLRLYLRRRYQPDTSRLPDTAELARRFHASRQDVRAALDELRRRHFIRPGRNGWLYRTSPIHLHVTWPHPPEPQQLLDPRGWQLQYRTRAPRQRTAPVEVARSLELAPGDPAIYLSCLVLADGDPAAYSTSWIHPDHAEALMAQPQENDSDTVTELLAQHGIASRISELRIEIQPPHPRIARQLHLAGEPPTPQITSVYRTLGAGPLAYTTTLIHPQYFRLTLGSPQ